MCNFFSLLFCNKAALGLFIPFPISPCMIGTNGCWVKVWSMSKTRKDSSIYVTVNCLSVILNYPQTLDPTYTHDSWMWRDDTLTWVKLWTGSFPPYTHLNSCLFNIFVQPLILTFTQIKNKFTSVCFLSRASVSLREGSGNIQTTSSLAILNKKEMMQNIQIEIFDTLDLTPQQSVYK